MHLAGNIFLALCSLLIVFHLLVMAGEIPFHIVWGSRLKNRKQMIKFELISISTLLIIVILIMQRLQYLSIWNNPSIDRGAMWAIFALFALNTFGNFQSPNPFEKYGFGTLTLILAGLSLLLAV